MVKAIQDKQTEAVPASADKEDSYEEAGEEEEEDFDPTVDSAGDIQEED